MTPFLKIVADDLYKKLGGDFEQTTIIFPNKRAEAIGPVEQFSTPYKGIPREPLKLEVSSPIIVNSIRIRHVRNVHEATVLLVKAILRQTMDTVSVAGGSGDVTVGVGKYLLEQLKGEAYCEGYRFLDTTLAPAKKLLFGDFSQLVLALWSGTDIKVDPFTLSTSGALRIVALQDCDYLVRHAAAFAVGNTVLS